MADALPVLYSFRRCPYAMRARLAIAISAQTCSLREVVLRHKPAELLTASPKATVPVLVLADGRVLEQSLDIMVWALQQHDPQHWLVPQTGTLDAMLALIADCDDGFKTELDRYKYPNRYIGAVAAQSRDQGALYLTGLENILATHSGETAYLFGERPALADMAIAPFVRQYAQTDTLWFDAQPWPKLQGWLTAFCTSGLYQAIMHKYSPWVAGSADLIFPTSTGLRADH
jgi:glutathione S-transferase